MGRTLTPQAENDTSPDIIEAQLMLGQLHLDRKEYTAALDWFRAAARGGSIAAVNMMGRCHEMGWGVEANAAISVEYYRSASNAGDVWAKFNLAGLYKRGLGVEKDPNEAFRLYAQAAIQGHVKSLNMLGLFYEDGLCVPVDLVEAIRYFQAGAEGGDCWAQFNLARLLLNQGKSDDAKTWLRKALLTGFPDFYRAMGRLLLSQSDPELMTIGKQALAKAG